MNALPPVSDPQAPPRAWWRDNGLWLLGAALLIVLVFGRDYRQAIEQHQFTDPRRPIDVPAGQWRHYEGARWRLLGVERIDDVGAASGFNLRADSSVLMVRYEVIPDPGTTADALNLCEGRLAAPGNRHWQANGLWLSRYSRGKRYPTGCGSNPGPNFTRVEAQPGRPYPFVHLYQIPRTQTLQGARAELRMAYPRKEPKGTYLRFSL